MFLSTQSAMSWRAWGSIPVVTNVARFRILRQATLRRRQALPECGVGLGDQWIGTPRGGLVLAGTAMQGHARHYAGTCPGHAADSWRLCQYRHPRPPSRRTRPRAAHHLIPQRRLTVGHETPAVRPDDGLRVESRILSVRRRFVRYLCAKLAPTCPARPCTGGAESSEIPSQSGNEGSD